MIISGFFKAKEPKNGEAFALLIAPSPMPLVCMLVSVSMCVYVYTVHGKSFEGGTFVVDTKFTIHWKTFAVSVCRSLVPIK